MTSYFSKDEISQINKLSFLQRNNYLSNDFLFLDDASLYQKQMNKAFKITNRLPSLSKQMSEKESLVTFPIEKGQQ